MKTKHFFMVISFIIGLFQFLSGNPIFIRNTLKDIDSCEGKIELTLVRVWGDESGDDENQFFRFPSDIKIGKNNLVYIVDSGNNRIQVFSRDGRYKKTIGRKGQGPADTILPRSISFDNANNLVIADYGNYRIQIIDSNGNYISGFKTIRSSPSNIHVTQNNEIAVYSYEQSFITRSLIFLYDYKGKIIKRLGKVYDNATSIGDFESIFFTLDKNDNVFVAHYATPLYCKYSNNGELLMVVTYEMPSQSPTVEINKTQTEPIIRGKKKSMISAGISLDKRGSIYLVIATRPKKENEIFYLTGRPGNMRRYPRNIDSEKTDRFRLLVFNQSGKVIAAKRLNFFCDKIYVHNNSFFIIDQNMGMQIYEFKISFLLNRRKNEIQ